MDRDPFTPEPQTPEWYVDTGTQRLGPYTISQLQDLLDRGEIQASFRVGKQVNIENNIESSIIVMDLIQANIDPTFTLLDALQAVRNKKFTPPPPYQPAQQEMTLRVSRKSLFSFLFFIILCFFVFLVGYWMQPDYSTSVKDGSEKDSAAETPQLPPVQRSVSDPIREPIREPIRGIPPANNNPNANPEENNAPLGSILRPQKPPEKPINRPNIPSFVNMQKTPPPAARDLNDNNVDNPGSSPEDQAIDPELRNPLPPGDDIQPPANPDQPGSEP
jgi:hypothetical protein